MEISESVLEMGKKYKNVGIETLLISFIITHVSKQHMRKKAIEINKILQSKCYYNQFVFFDNRNIGKGDLWEDSLLLKFLVT